MDKHFIMVQETPLPPCHPDLEDTYELPGRVSSGPGNNEDAAKYGNPIMPSCRRPDGRRGGIVATP
ncbi:MAG: hypothetical protein J0M04_17980 [Verrucomicrobia bacterium]|nr:hypothetical protein [Verrucomicrobiota bacterium]